jgi:hypothetical protein
MFEEFPRHPGELHMRRIRLAAVLVTLALAGPALAVTSPSSLEGSRPPSAVPEPAAILLFAAGIGVGAWALRRRGNRS